MTNDEYFSIMRHIGTIKTEAELNTFEGQIADRVTGSPDAPAIGERLVRQRELIQSKLI